MSERRPLRNRIQYPGGAETNTVDFCSFAAGDDDNAPDQPDASSGVSTPHRHQRLMAQYAPKVSDVAPPLIRGSGHDRAPACSSSPLTFDPSPMTLNSPFPMISFGRKLSTASLEALSVAETIADGPHPAVVFVGGESTKCLSAARLFAVKLTHFLAWYGCSVRLFFLGSDANTLIPATSADEWRHSLNQTASVAHEYIHSSTAVNHMNSMTTSPIAVILGDFGREHNERTAAERVFDNVLHPHASPSWSASGSAMSADSPDTPMHRCASSATRSSASFVHINFDESDKELLIPPGRCQIRVNCSNTLVQATKFPGVVTSAIMSYLLDILPLLTRVYALEPSHSSSTETLSCMPPIFFTRHGQSVYNLEDRLGGNPDLTPSGMDDASAIAQFFQNEVLNNSTLFPLRTTEWDRDEGFSVWASQLTRSCKTAEPIANLLTRGVIRKWSGLNEIHAGICEDMTNDEIRDEYPELQDFRKKNKVAFRYPGGESYLDLMRRLTPVLVELESTPQCVVVVAHQAVLRTILSYFGGLAVEEAVIADCPHRAVWCCSFDAIGNPRLSAISLPSLSLRKASAWVGL